MKLYHRTHLGAIKFLDIQTEGPKLITTWGLLNGKTQTTTKICKGMNIGRSNETSPKEQAKLEMKAKIEKKAKEGYSSKKPTKESSTVQTKIDLDNLPINLCPNKPINQSNLPEKILNGINTYGQRKHNGHCIILVKGKTTEKIYSRRMEDLTPYVSQLKVIKDAMSKIPKGSLVLHEMVFHHTALDREVPRFVGTLVKTQDKKEVFEKYSELSKIGTYSLIPFDALFLNYDFIGDQDYKTVRVLLLQKENINVPELYDDWKQILEDAKQCKWEGLVLRVPGEKSYISYSMDGKAHRAGSWKYKFIKEGDFFVDKALKGKSGKHAKFYAKFHVAQYDDKGNYVDRGYVGCGTFSHTQLETLTEQIDSGKQKLPFVIQVEYQSIHDESGALEFGQPQGDVGIRADKLPKECIADE